MTIVQRRAYTEMLEILDNMSSKIKSKIPNSLIEKMNAEKDNEWNFRYDEKVALEKQNILYSTKILFSYIYTNYIATEEKRRELELIYEENSKTKYNPDNLFARKNTQVNKEEIHTSAVSETALETTNKKWYKKLFNKFINILRKIN